MSLHNAIMNLPCVNRNGAGTVAYSFYRFGHRDARHAAAELALEHDAELSAARAEVERLRGIAGRELSVQSVSQAAEYPWGNFTLWVYPFDALHPIVGRPGVYSITLGKTDDAAICHGHRSRIELFARRDFNVEIPAEALAPKETP